ncbi:MAG: hypothetical protein HRT66_12660 [Flavobacteriaceae bacterium]|nr:hypothetical protein [Flavobacteriaceae bacterium]
MSNIYFFYCFLIVIFSMLIIVGLIKIRYSKKNEQVIMACIIAIVVGSYNLYDKLYNGPSLDSLLEYHSEFQSIDASSINEIHLYVDMFERNPIKDSIIINDRVKIDKVIVELQRIEPVYISLFKRRALKSYYDIEIVYKGVNYTFIILEYSDGNFYIKLIYVDDYGDRWIAGYYEKKVYTNSILRIKNLADIDIKPSK